MTDEPWTHRIKASGWPERVGHRCHLVTPTAKERSRYPFKDETMVVVLIEHDPVIDPATLADGTRWSCVIEPGDLELIP